MDKNISLNELLKNHKHKKKCIAANMLFVGIKVYSVGTLDGVSKWVQKTCITLNQLIRISPSLL